MKKSDPQTDAVVIVQARMGSARLPGKMMMDLGGQPLLWHILRRAQTIGDDLPVVLAIPDTPQDEVLAQVGGNCGVTVVRGSQEDVLGRFLAVLEKFPARWVVRICGDSPLFGVEHLRRCLELARRTAADVIKFSAHVGTLLQGGEVVSRQALEFSRVTAPGDPLAVEHVTAWALNHAEDYPAELKVTTIDPDPDLVLNRKLSIDTVEDLERLRLLYRELWDGDSPVDLPKVAAWLQKPAQSGWPRAQK